MRYKIGDILERSLPSGTIRRKIIKYENKKYHAKLLETDCKYVMRTIIQPYFYFDTFYKLVDEIKDIEDD